MSWPVRSTAVKKTYYQTRGKVHLKRDEDMTHCGCDLGDINHSTENIKEVTCQKCLMVKTKNWKPKGKRI